MPAERNHKSSVKHLSRVFHMKFIVKNDAEYNQERTQLIPTKLSN